MDQPDETVLSDGVLVNGTATSAALSAAGKITWVSGGGGPRRRLDVAEEVLGSSTNGNKIEIRAVVERGEKIFCGGNTGDVVRERFFFEFSTVDSARVWGDKLQECIHSLDRPKRLLVFVNPYGGSKFASKIFADDVKPLLEDANVEYNLQETTHQLHAKEVANSLDLTKYNGIVCVSGDGILVEVVNGLLERGNWNDAIKMPLGAVPASTGNGMAKSLLDAVGLPCTAFHATLAIIRGHKRSLDVATVLQGETEFFSVLMLAWGLVADIDIESEKYKWMGKARFDVYALQRMIRLRKYSGCISFVPAPGFEDFGEPSSRTDESAFYDNKVQQCGYLGPDIDLESSTWRKFDGPFVLVWLHNVPWGAENTKAAPDAKVKALVLEPGSRIDDPTKGGIIDVDGEVLAQGKGTYKSPKKSLMNYDKLQLSVDKGLATIFSPHQN